ncbi:ankyrin repeat-containing protein NPR4 [Beta vulgaris subsp. vulgaris]|uniref:ankyrin repeat-containing protein NPR4 n=1 Tax=Beta vulgaris subsp. vulgaris TaxID=3555 RepID=UPI002549A1C6|nr:ankyrin repeat-containing protein NPR4 [Beta vulgaris subsp. vulgaris]
MTPIGTPSSRTDPRPDKTSEEFLKYGVRLYQAALKADWSTINMIHFENPSWICKQITKGGETLLHIAAAAKHVELVKKLVGIMSIESLALANSVQNTALCFAAVSGVVEIAQAMVEKNKELPNIRGSQGMTPLYMAVLLGHRQMVWYLLNVTDDSQITDQDRIGLLTSSIDSDLYDVALHILNEHKYLAYLRDENEETALHVLAQKKPVSYQMSMWKRCIQWDVSLLKEKTRPACCSIFVLGSSTDQDISIEPPGFLQLTQNLWDEVIKLKSEDISKLIGDPWRLLFVAAKWGKVEFLTTLIRSYPDLIWKVDENRHSIFHIAIIHRHEEIFKLIYEIGAIKDLIATYKDDNGNNMLHLACKLAPTHRLNCVSGAALQMQREIQWFKAVKKVVSTEYAEAENKDLKTPHSLFSEEHEELRAKGEEWMKKTAESCALVATLIATVVFSAAFQLPGGVDSEGSPNLMTRASFVVFALSNAVSLFTSTASVLMFLSILTSRYAESDFLISLPLKLMMGLTLLFLSIATMMVAFTATFYMTLDRGVKWAPLPVALFASIPVALFALQQYPLLVDIFRSTYKSHQFLIESSKSVLFEVSTSNNLSSYECIGTMTSQHPSSIYPSPHITIGKSHQSSSHRRTPSQIVDPSATVYSDRKDMLT